MKLYITPTSPYGRAVRMVIAAKGLGDRVEIETAQTRTAGSPYYVTNPSGRVPYLVLDDGRGFEDSRLISAWLDQLDGAPTLSPPAGEDHWEHERLEALARSFLDGLAVLLREYHRPEDERSPGIISHERSRAGRMLALWETEIDNPLMQGPLNMAQIILVVALQTLSRIPDLDWKATHAALAGWLALREQDPVFSAA